MTIIALLLALSPILTTSSAGLPISAGQTAELADPIFLTSRKSDQPSSMGIPFSNAPITGSYPRYPEVPAWSEGVSNPNAWEIEKLCDSVSQNMHDRQFDKAESTLNQAISLNEPYFNSGIYSYLTDQLSIIYQQQHRFSELESLYQTKSKRLSLWDSQAFQDRVASLFIEEERFGEARAILRQYVPKMKPPPPGGFCGNPYRDYAVAQNRYKYCVNKTAKMTDEQLDRIYRELEKQFTAETMKH
ncbi:MAG: hypothetical protein EKK48_10585 [Candidatus Melainabacteria bacterium]|nr:MAG: hypothetical protein EKK48_10585 [Candidatus Melainabacteria bacterium]